jgi:hypothetical protein
MMRSLPPEESQGDAAGSSPFAAAVLTDAADPKEKARNREENLKQFRAFTVAAGPRNQGGSLTSPRVLAAPRRNFVSPGVASCR